MSKKPYAKDSNTLVPMVISRCGMLVCLLLLFVVLVRGNSFSSLPVVQAEIPEEEILTEEEEEDTSAPLEDATATIAYSGDFMVHTAVTDAAYDSESDSYDFVQFFTYAGTWLQDADFAITNLECALAGKVNGYPAFSGPDDLVDSLLTLGIDFVTTANNHCADFGRSGILRTIQTLDEYGLDHIGTYASQEEYDENMGVVVEEVNGITIAFLDYTYGINYVELSDDYLVNRYNANTKDESEASMSLDTEKLDAEMAYARSLDTDLIIVLIHWGTEYRTYNSTYQEEIADYFIAQGADAILGGHSHVPQPMEYRTVTDIDGNEKTAFVCYSLGNLISNMKVDNSYYTAILNLEITRTDGVTSITGISYEPMYLINPNNSSSSSMALLDIPAALADYESGNANPYVTESMYNSLQTAMSNISNIFGTEWEISYNLTTQDSDTSDTSLSVTYNN